MIGLRLPPFQWEVQTCLIEDLLVHAQDPVLQEGHLAGRSQPGARRQQGWDGIGGLGGDDQPRYQLRGDAVGSGGLRGGFKRDRATAGLTVINMN